jgi:hypothetical protein
MSVQCMLCLVVAGSSRLHRYLLLVQVQRSSSEELAFQPAARFEPVMQEVGASKWPLPLLQS